MEGVIGVEDPRTDDVRRLLEAHLALMNASSPPEDVHALDVEALTHPSITFLTYRVDGELIGVGAIKDHGDGQGELKSMHTAAAARGRGVAGLLVQHLLDLAVDRGMTRVSLETGTQDVFAPARALYGRHGFVECGPFADYDLSPSSAFFTRELEVESWTA
ncbi:GNAT family N-acetyltransferase [Nocardioides mangrovi]|uniref:GNAT family N-acetyltransferase n=1 Tax=Nocardioides mangrovi TaxID=2874580 RepID=A0ABS7UJR0_9ACTN|nr:GNAT family N-acetyltransferase [Nocardioides mangrovi]MBZ5741259.1 GNAT family N-acetyltransferase [Nocardioides mangrovi]